MATRSVKGSTRRKPRTVASILADLQKPLGQVPEGQKGKVPVDLGANVDYYLYAALKKK